LAQNEEAADPLSLPNRCVERHQNGAGFLELRQFQKFPNRRVNFSQCGARLLIEQEGEELAGENWAVCFLLLLIKSVN
jgi:hypothetical protein